MDEKLQVDTGILDFSKAFDKVGCYTNWIRGNLQKCLSSFLSGRFQQVVVDGSVSSTCKK